MPNWCTNYLAVTGQETGIDKFISQIPIDSNGYGRCIFQKFVPISSGDTAIEKWGTKWDVKDIDMERAVRYKDKNDDTYCLYLETAWAPPVEAITAISAKFPELDFGISWYEEGMCFYGYALMKDGELLQRVDGDIPDFYELAQEKLEQEIQEEASKIEHKFIDNIEDQLLLSLNQAPEAMLKKRQLNYKDTEIQRDYRGYYVAHVLIENDGPDYYKAIQADSLGGIYSLIDKVR